MARGKRYQNSIKKTDRLKKYSVDEAIQTTVTLADAKFDEAIDVSLNLGVDPKQGDQNVRGAVTLPHGLGKSVRVLVFAKGPKEEEAKKAGADFVGADDLVQKIQGGWLEFDKAVATPDMMATVSKVAKILGPKGLMPNPKLGTVTMDLASVVSAEKRGRSEFRVDKAGIIHASVGKKSMGAEKLKDNFLALLSAVMKSKPASSKGVYLQKIAMSSTMGPSVKIDVNQAQGLVS